MTPGAQRSDIVVTGLGICSPAGRSAEASWRTVYAAEPTAATDAVLAGLPVTMACRVPGFSADDEIGPNLAWRTDRFVQLALVSAREAAADAGLDRAVTDPNRVGVVVGNSLGGTQTFEDQHHQLRERGPRSVSPLTIPRSMGNMAAGFVSADLNARGPSLGISTACASGTTALGVASDMLRSGRCDLVVAGGSESAISPSSVAALNRMGALSRRCDVPSSASRPFDVARDGFVIGEGAGFLVLETREHAVARGADVRAVLEGFGASSDCHHPTAPRPDGSGIEDAVVAALNDAGLRPDQVDHVNAHGTSTPLNDRSESAALERLFGREITVTSTKGVTGHCLAAAGAIEAALTVLSLERRVVPQTANLVHPDPEVRVDVVTGSPRPQTGVRAVSTSLGFGGHNAAAVFCVA